MSANNKGKKHLISAACQGHTKVVKLLIDHGAGLAHSTLKESTPLQLAMSNSHLAVVRLLIERRASLSAGPSKISPIVVAAAEGNVQARLLLEKGADTSFVGTDGFITPLQYAAENDHFQLVRVLLAKGTKLSAINSGGRTALTWALNGGNKAIAKLLLQNGAYEAVKGKDHKYGSLANLIALKGHTDLLRLAMQRTNDKFHLLDAQQRPPVHIAARGGNFSTFQYLVDSGLDCTSMDAKGENLIYFAAPGGSLTILNFFLRQYPHLIHGKSVWSPLHWACRAGHAEVVEILVAHGLQHQSVTISGMQDDWTPLAVAVF